MPAEERNQNIEELRRRLEEMETVIAALRDGSADAMVADTGLVWFTGSERPYRAFFEAMNEGGLSLDETGRILHCNPCFAAMAEDTVGGLRGRHFIDFVAPDDRVHITDYLAGGKPGIIDATLLPASRMARPQCCALSISRASPRAGPSVSLTVGADLGKPTVNQKMFASSVGRLAKPISPFIRRASRVHIANPSSAP